jgi:uncharacterized OsmC-like protein
MEITAYWQEGYRTRVPIRRFEIKIDEPKEYGGEDAGPMPTEVFLASLASCFAIAVAHAAQKRDAKLDDLAVRVKGVYEGLRFAHLTVEVVSAHERGELEELTEQAIEYCYISNTLAEPPSIDYIVVNREVTHG